VLRELHFARRVHLGLADGANLVARTSARARGR